MSDALTHVAIGDIIAKALAKSGNPYLNSLFWPKKGGA